MKKLREIVKDAYKCDGLVFQFEELDASDKWLGITHNSEYTIKHYIKENRQLRKFLKKYKG